MSYHGNSRASELDPYREEVKAKYSKWMKATSETNTAMYEMYEAVLDHSIKANSIIKDLEMAIDLANQAELEEGEKNEEG